MSTSLYSLKETASSRCGSHGLARRPALCSEKTSSIMPRSTCWSCGLTVNRSAPRLLQRFPPIGRHSRHVAVPVQEGLEQRKVLRVIVNDQDPFHDLSPVLTARV